MDVAIHVKVVRSKCLPQRKRETPGEVPYMTMADTVQLGLRVVRGPDWEWGDQDGGEGHVGTVVEVGDQDSANQPRSAIIQWDSGERSRYRCGLDEKYDLRVLDNGPVGVRHLGISCDECGQSSVSGIRWKCAQCHNYDLCTACYMDGKHNCEHAFLRFVTPNPKSRMQPRKNSRQVMIKGAFPGADVIRGKDWNHEDKDGGEGELGKIIILSDVGTETYRGVAEVEWQKTGLITKCRVGHEGKVDIHCVVPETVGSYYIDHLPVLGAPNIPPGPEEFSTGDVVKVELDTEVFMLLQQGHGGWNDKMAEFKGRPGKIHHIKDSGDLLVVFGSNGFVINPAAVIKTDIKSSYKPGNVVRIMDDRAEVVKLQKGHGEWNEDMLDSLGQTGVVRDIDSLGDVRVMVKDRVWWYNAECLSLITEKSEDGSSEESQLGQTKILGYDAVELRGKMELLKTIGSSDVLAHAALLGEEETIKEYLDEYPNDVNSKYCNKTALHCAAAAGKASVAKLLIKYQADIHSKDEMGLTPLHHSAIRNEKEVAAVLLEAGADPNLKTAAELTPIVIAIHRNSPDVLELLANHPKIDLCSPNRGGDTPLHVAVTEQNLSAVRILLKAGGDITAVNFKLCTPMHVAAELGYIVLIEEFLEHHPEHINLRGSELGLTILHFAVICDNLQVVNFLLKQPTCDTEARNSTQLTPFLMSAASGSLKVMERLVGFGADVMAIDEDGDTAVHLVLKNNVKEYEMPTDECQEMKKVQRMIGEGASPKGVLCCFLVYVGVDVNATNLAGLSPLEICEPVLAVTIASFADKHKGESKLHGSLKQSMENSDQHDNETPCNDRQQFQACSSSDNEQSQTTSACLPTSTNTSQVSRPQATITVAETSVSNLSIQRDSVYYSTVSEDQPHSDQLNVLPSGQIKSTADLGTTVSPLTDSTANAMHTEPDGTSFTTNHDNVNATQAALHAVSSDCKDDSKVYSSTSDRPICLLCDEPVTVRLLPCGHEIICLLCSKRAKKCLQCKRIVTARVNLSAL